jgi:hypothetical protein
MCGKPAYPIRRLPIVGETLSVSNQSPYVLQVVFPVFGLWTPRDDRACTCSIARLEGVRPGELLHLARPVHMHARPARLGQHVRRATVRAGAADQ